MLSAKCFLVTSATVTNGYILKDKFDFIPFRKQLKFCSLSNGFLDTMPLSTASLVIRHYDLKQIKDINPANVTFPL